MDECPTGAICYENNNVPQVIEEDCNDCGVCIPMCVTEAIMK
jgi:Fe-S-cluster-containing hydrogenase component 2